MMGRLPTVADFPSSITLNIVPPPQHDPATNVLILLHGLGDTVTSFTQLATQLRLPETACIAVQAPRPLLDLGGFHWGEDLVFDSTTGTLDPDAGFASSTALVRSLIYDTLISKCGYAAREVLLFGLGQGGMVALNVAANATGDAAAATLKRDEDVAVMAAVGGVVSIGGPLPGAAPAECTPKARTPVIVCAGLVDGSAVSAGAEEKLRRVFANVAVARYRRRGDGMPKDRGEMLPVMQFFERTLRSVKGVPADSVEIG